MLIRRLHGRGGGRRAAFTVGHEEKVEREIEERGGREEKCVRRLSRKGKKDLLTRIAGTRIKRKKGERRKKGEKKGEECVIGRGMENGWILLLY